MMAGGSDSDEGDGSLIGIECEETEERGPHDAYGAGPGRRRSGLGERGRGAPPLARIGGAAGSVRDAAASTERDGTPYFDTTDLVTVLQNKPLLLIAYEYWQELKAEGATPVPRRAALEIERLKRVLHHVTLLEVIEQGADFRYRVFGTGLVRATGRDLTGQRVSELGHEIRPIATRLYSKVVRDGKPRYACHPAPAEHHVESWERVVLPLSTDGTDVSQLLVVFDPGDWRRQPRMGL